MFRIKNVINILVFLYLLVSLQAQNNALDSSLLHTSVHYLDNILMDCLHKLEIISNTPQARAGDWSGIKSYLGQAAESLPGVYFYVLQDGNYYSLERDFTNLNLRNRAYFDSLFLGHNILGIDIYSRSSGKKSALMAVPILVDGQVRGALGASVFLDDLHRRFNAEIQLPEDYTWFVLNQSGLTMLDKDLEYIFQNPLLSGSSSMQAALGYAMLSSEAGESEYEVGSTRRSTLYQKLPHLDWWFFLAAKDRIQSSAQQRLTLSLENFVPELQANLDRIDLLTRSAAELDRNVTFSEDTIRNMLNAVLQSAPLATQAAFVNLEGIMEFIEPCEYVNFEGTDISGQEHVSLLRQTGRPVFSPAFMTVEGFQAVSLAVPIFDEANNLLGSLSILIRPELLCRSIISRLEIPAEHEITIMQTNGLIIYEEDEEEVGRNLFTDPLFSGFESLQELGHRIRIETSGEGDYSYVSRGHQQVQLKMASWATVGLYDREWRVIIAKPVD